MDYRWQVIDAKTNWPCNVCRIEVGENSIQLTGCSPLLGRKADFRALLFVHVLCIYIFFIGKFLICFECHLVKLFLNLMFSN